MANKKLKYGSLFGTTVLAVGLLSACSSASTPKLSGLPTDMQNACDDWDRRKDGSYKCDDDDSKYRGGYFFNGSYFTNHNAMTGSSNYRTNNLINGTSVKSSSLKSTSTSGKSTSAGKTGVGSGAKGGGAS